MPLETGAISRHQYVKSRADRCGNRDGGPVVSTEKAMKTIEN